MNYDFHAMSLGGLSTHQSYNTILRRFSFNLPSDYNEHLACFLSSNHSTSSKGNTLATRRLLDTLEEDDILDEEDIVWLERLQEFVQDLAARERYYKETMGASRQTAILRVNHQTCNESLHSAILGAQNACVSRRCHLPG